MVGTLLGRALARASLAVPVLRYRVVGTVAGLWSRSASACAVIGVPVVFRTTVLAFFAFAFALLVAPCLIRCTSTRVETFAVAKCMTPDVAGRA